MKTGFFSLAEQDRDELVNHLARLTPAERRLRFGATWSQEAMARWCRKIDLKPVAGYFHFGKLVAATFLCQESAQRSEFAISVDKEFRGTGLAHRLLALALANCNEERLVIRHAVENTAMAGVHKGYESRKKYAGGDVDVEIDAGQLRREELQAYGLACGTEI